MMVGVSLAHLKPARPGRGSSASTAAMVHSTQYKRSNEGRIENASKKTPSAIGIARNVYWVVPDHLVPSAKYRRLGDDKYCLRPDSLLAYYTRLIVPISSLAFRFPNVRGGAQSRCTHSAP